MQVVLSEDQTAQTAQRALSNPDDSSVTRPRSILLQTSHNERANMIPCGGAKSSSAALRQSHS
ncbi:hypothetical protein N7449_008381 [Penicillium cf. viridicatum]|uniref:Uncharacterized protein n=1 Tax=Penicillium cf. viridicatum TaxID=2972119 RepID=A0A9W9J818_9EURO|nr:hypothetical protein N7449_008381 [Penicillium cf. viridicatum]